MTDIVRRSERFGWPEDWFEHGMPSFLRPPAVAALQAMRVVEEYIQEGRYVLRAELRESTLTRTSRSLYRRVF